MTTGFAFLMTLMKLLSCSVAVVFPAVAAAWISFTSATIAAQLRSVPCTLGRTENFPTLGYQFHSGHNRCIFHVSGAFPGARNDKTIVRFDEHLDELIINPKYANYTYSIKTKIGRTVTMEGLWALCDGGYHKWLHTIYGSKHADTASWRAWSGLCESTRKDVECVFGVMKARFRVLAIASLVSDAQSCTRTVRVCAILHNMLLLQDGMAQNGTEESHWRRVDEAEAKSFGVRLPLPVTTFRVGSNTVGVEEEEVDDGFDQKRQQLVDHYMHELRNGNILFKLNPVSGPPE